MRFGPQRAFHVQMEMATAPVSGQAPQLLTGGAAYANTWFAGIAVPAYASRRLQPGLLVEAARPVSRDADAFGSVFLRGAERQTDVGLSGGFRLHLLRDSRSQR